MIREKRITVIPLQSVNGVEFGTERKAVRKIIRGKYMEIKRNVYSENTMDAHGDYNLYFTKDDRLEAVEVVGKTKVFVDGVQLYPGTIDRVMTMFPNMKPDDEGFIDEDNSVAITVSQDDGKIIDSILFAVKGYFE